MNPNSQWYYSQSGAQTGPVSLPELRAMLASSRIHATDLVWTEGMSEWVPAGTLPALQSAAPQAAVPPPAAAPSYYQQPPPQVQGYNQAAALGYVPSYGSAYGYDASRGPSQQGMAIAGLVLSFFMPLLGLIFSVIALNGMKTHRNNEGKGLATAGLIISIAWFALGCVWFIFVFAIAASAAGH